MYGRALRQTRRSSIGGALASRRFARLAAVLAVALTAVVPASAAAAVGDAAARRAAGLAPGTAFSAFAASVLTRPAPVRGTDGAFHLVYELVLTNTTPITLSIEGLRVGSGRTHRTLLSLSGPALTANAEPLGGAPGANEGGVVEDLTAPATT